MEKYLGWICSHLGQLDGSTLLGNRGTEAGFVARMGERLKMRGNFSSEFEVSVGHG